MYGRIPYLNISLISWAIHRSNLRYFLYYSQACSGTPLSAPLHVLSQERIGYMVGNIHQLNLSPRPPLTHSRELHLQPQELLR